MRLPADPRLPLFGENWQKQITSQLNQLLRNFSAQLNGISEGRIYSFHNSLTSAPTTGDYNKGDFILNTAPEELGSASSKYIIHGWRCTVSGSPGTWVEMRFLTGN